MATSSIQLVPLKSELIGLLEALEWQPAGNSSPTSFIGGVHRTLKFTSPQQSPWCCVIDEEPEVIKRAVGGGFYEKRTPIAIYILSSYETITEEEAEDRMLYAYEAVERLLVLDSLISDIGAPGAAYRGWQPVDLGTVKVFGRKLVLEIQSKI